MLSDRVIVIKSVVIVIFTTTLFLRTSVITEISIRSNYEMIGKAAIGALPDWVALVNSY